MYSSISVPHTESYTFDGTFSRDFSQSEKEEKIYYENQISWNVICVAGTVMQKDHASVHSHIPSGSKFNLFVRRFDQTAIYSIFV